MIDPRLALLIAFCVIVGALLCAVAISMALGIDLREWLGGDNDE